MVTKNGLFRFLGRRGCSCIRDTSMQERGSPTVPLSADVTSPGRSMLRPESHVLALYKLGHPQKAERARVGVSLEMMSSKEGWRTLCITEARQARLPGFLQLSRA